MVSEGIIAEGTTTPAEGLAGELALPDKEGLVRIRSTTEEPLSLLCKEI